MILKRSFLDRRIVGYFYTRHPLLPHQVCAFTASSTVERVRSILLLRGSLQALGDSLGDDFEALRIVIHALEE